MEEKIGLIKWLTTLPDKQRNTAYSLIAITFLSSVVYGFGKYIKSSSERDIQECRDYNARLINKCDNLQKEFDNFKEYHIKYVEEHSSRLEKQKEHYEELWVKTQQLEQKRR